VAKDYYKVLGINKRASDREIKQAYRKLARELHPDVTGDDPGATERFKIITEAYETLSDPKRRKLYDRFGGPADKSLLDSLGVTDLVDQIQKIFQRDGTEPVPGVDCELDTRITFAESYLGLQREVPVTLTRPCSQCQATGLVDDKTCPGCSGRRTRIQTEQLRVTFPAGISDGTRLRLKERGTAGRNEGPPGDLFLNVEVSDEEGFERHADDLFCEVRVRLREALLGGAADVKLPGGGVLTVTIPPGTQGGQMMRVPKKGFVRLGGGGRGDLFVTVQIQIPRKLGADAHALLQELAEVVPDL
jgi:molecular chaperone DnaJ